MSNATNSRKIWFLVSSLLIVSAVALFVLLMQGATRNVVSEEPEALTIPTGQIVLVDDGTCPLGQILEVTGSTPGVERPRRCIPYPIIQLLFSRAELYGTSTISLIYGLLGVMATLGGAIAFVQLIQGWLRKP